tara:strand:+ start:523 stop:774 length:252 start_codon:yes stop_codon:yes gene_type:complete
MSYESWKITVLEEEVGSSCSVCPSFLDNQNKFLKYKVPDKKTKDKNEETNMKTISKMLRKKMERYVDKKHKSNIKRKANEYNF